MPASDSLTSAIPAPPASPDRPQLSVHVLPHWITKTIVATKAGLVIVGLFSVQQALVQLCNDCWQISSLFALIGLMIVLMLGQYYLNQRQSKFIERWTAVSSIIITALGMGMIFCILTTPIAV